MRKVWLLILISAGGLWPYQGTSQGLTDEVLRFSQAPMAGSARIQGLGFSQVALGGDLSSAFSNPAGLGFFNRSEATFTPALNFYSADSYLEHKDGTRSQPVSDSRAVLNFANLGVVFHKELEDEFIKGGAFGLSISKTKDFNNRITYQRDKDNVDVDYFDFVFNKFDNGNEDTYSDLAYEAYLVDIFEVDDGMGNLVQYYDYIAADIENLEYPDLQRESRITKGSEYSVNLAYGVNFGDRLYLGASIGLLTLDYREISRYSEYRSNASLSEFTLQEKVDITGAGINGTLGIMARPVDMLILGASLTTPSFYRFEDIYEAQLNSTFNNYTYVPENRQLTTEEALSDVFVSNYSLRTPLKFNTGASIFIGKHGFITGEVEFLNFSYNHLSSSDFDTVGDNQLMDNEFGFVTNYRLGAEFRSGIFRLRGGYAFSDDPRKSGDVDASTRSFTFGGGVKFPNFYIDLAIVNSWYDSSISPFASSMYNTVENRRVSAIIGAGFNF